MSLKFTTTHEWIKQEPGQPCTVGITEHAQASLGDMVYVELPTLGSHVHAGESIAVVESVKAASDVYAPISGTITAINTALSQTPDIINTDPYGAGWLIQMEPTDPKELDHLLTEQRYQQTLATEH